MTDNPLTTERLKILLADTLRATASRGEQDSIEICATIFISVLTEVLAGREAEGPVAFTDARQLRYLESGRETAKCWGRQNAGPGDVALYRAAQCQPPLCLAEKECVDGRENTGRGGGGR